MGPEVQGPELECDVWCVWISFLCRSLVQSWIGMPGLLSYAENVFLVWAQGRQMVSKVGCQVAWVVYPDICGHRNKGRLNRYNCQMTGERRRAR